MPEKIQRHFYIPQVASRAQPVQKSHDTILKTQASRQSWWLMNQDNTVCRLLGTLIYYISTAHMWGKCLCGSARAKIWFLCIFPDFLEARSFFQTPTMWKPMLDHFSRHHMEIFSLDTPQQISTNFDLASLSTVRGPVIYPTLVTWVQWRHLFVQQKADNSHMDHLLPLVSWNSSVSCTESRSADGQGSASLLTRLFTESKPSTLRLISLPLHYSNQGPIFRGDRLQWTKCRWSACHTLCWMLLVPRPLSLATDTSH